MHKQTNEMFEEEKHLKMQGPLELVSSNLAFSQKAEGEAEKDQKFICK